MKLSVMVALCAKNAYADLKAADASRATAIDPFSVGHLALPELIL
jgi:hypothetical protein